MFRRNDNEESAAGMSMLFDLVMVSEEDKPTKMDCLSCSEELNDFHDFRKLAMTSDLKFRQISKTETLDVGNGIKFEVADEELMDLSNLTENGGNTVENDLDNWKFGLPNETASDVTENGEINNVSTEESIKLIPELKLGQKESLYMENELFASEDLKSVMDGTGGDLCCNSKKNKETVELLDDKHQRHQPYNVHQCLTCGEQFSHSIFLHYHIINHHPHSPVACFNCKAKFPNKDKFYQHYRDYHSGGPKMFGCNMCGIWFKTLRIFKDHDEEHAKQHISYYLMNLRLKLRAGKRYFGKRNLDENVKVTVNKEIPVGIKRKRYESAYCRNEFYEKENVSEPMRACGGKRRYGCNMDVVNVITAKKRVRMIHDVDGPVEKLSKLEDRGGFSETEFSICGIRNRIGEKLYQCVQCDREFTIKSRLIRHIRIHTGEKPFQYTQCNCKFSQKETLSIHLRARTSVKPYQCNQCVRGLRTKRVFGRLSKTHTDLTSLKCNNCKGGFSEKRTHLYHVRSHRNDKSCQFDECSRGFFSKKTFNGHNREKSYICIYCDRKFLEKGNLIRHKLTHTGEKPYQCDQCGCRFTMGSNLVRHVQTHKFDNSLNVSHMIVDCN